ncbi:methylase [Lactobacillus delbrueckii subsp. lactis]|uniref:methylase n=1 Tax=Lactobacillus delbrueckii TaxID=1584 RepID=UPI001E4A7FAD|nr:methylase [Lactobacillus delbrueckii]MCD5436749.1 methylase [Lactobacillus delbrueckii subsp. lactis]MCD5441641.1 methylase [Lactobacillus delbrueckii subsp. lactis]MCD5445533.1 methylase [Lactobacillus delbrueckii subsp. lactis]MCD5493597.1 methylase [Lactobacillus delbrueckii subsp. lactis]MCD5534765.1 methylase [Lactobacillus delbrueckii subsp. sunkii]
MTDERLIKSADRVKDFGEVFTPKNIVDLMLDQPEISVKVNDLTATFLEPAAGEGAFLTELLTRKMQVALEGSTSVDNYEDRILLGLSSLYGIELMEDNYRMLRHNLYQTFAVNYLRGLKAKGQPEHGKPKVLKSAKTIIFANMVQGNTLTYKNVHDQPIVFSEWASYKQDGRIWVKRTTQTFESIVEGEQTDNGLVVPEDSQLDLFTDFDPDTLEVKSKDSYLQYKPIQIVDVYKEELVDTNKE